VLQEIFLKPRETRDTHDTARDTTQHAYNAKPRCTNTSISPNSSIDTETASHTGPTDKTLRANPFPEVTDLICRLPLPTLVYRPEASDLGDRMRI